MPEISRFFGAVITMYYNDHPPPHFHVRYGQQKALISIQTGEILQGNLSPRLLKLIQEWTALYKNELLANWELARQNLILNKIEPLE